MDQNMESLALHIRNVCRLPLHMDTPTPGRGNCFFAGVCQQLHREDLELLNVYENASQLRKLVCDFAIRKEHPMVKQLAEVHDTNASASLRSLWVPFFTNMKKNHVFAEGPVLYCTAFLLERDIAVMSFGNNEGNPYMLISGCGNPKYPPLYLGNLVDLHFQSFLPDKAVKKQVVPKARPQTYIPMPSTSTILIPKGSPTSTLPPTATLPSKSNLSPSHSPITTRPQRRIMHKMSDIASLGDDAIRNINFIIKENRKLHAYVKQLEFRIRHCMCQQPASIKQEQNMVDMNNLEDSISDDILMSTPL